VVALASRRSHRHVEVSFGDKTLKCKALDTLRFSDIDICLMSAGGAVSKEWSPKIAAAGRGRHRQLVDLAHGPGRAADRAGSECRRGRGFRKKGIIANPNCSTAQLVVALKPLHDAAKIKRVVVSTYQSVSGAGKDAMDELFSQTKAVYTNDETESEEIPEADRLQLIPQIDVFMEDGYTKEEWKMMAETKKILDPKIKLTATCVRVPVFIGHSEAVNIEFENPITPDEAREHPAQGAGLPRHRQARAGRLRHAVRGGRRGRDLYQPHPRGCDGRERPRAVVRVGQSAQGRGAQRGADRRGACQPQAASAEAEGVVIVLVRQARRGHGNARQRHAALRHMDADVLAVHLERERVALRKGRGAQQDDGRGGENELFHRSTQIGCR
jgi:aspartate-semialdehyde dehydrogenase